MRTVSIVPMAEMALTLLSVILARTDWVAGHYAFSRAERIRSLVRIMGLSFLSCALGTRVC